MNQPDRRRLQRRAANAGRIAAGRSRAAAGGVAAGLGAVADARRSAGKPVAYSTLFQ
jgi:hypothetical protein